jgi:hypothetical protein
LPMSTLPKRVEAQDQTRLIHAADFDWTAVSR